VQNRRKLSTYHEALEQGVPPVEKGYALSADDQIRRQVITELMCNGYLRRTETEARFSLDFDAYFSVELTELQAGPVADGLLRIDPEVLEATPLGRLFIRNIAMIFDRYLREKSREQPSFSRTV
jgi:oxygen-independent coproporphyrinogen-3 oxidase